MDDQETKAEERREDGTFAPGNSIGVETRIKPGEVKNPEGKTGVTYKENLEMLGLLDAPEQMKEKIVDVWPQLKGKPIDTDLAMAARAKIDGLQGNLAAIQFDHDVREGKPRQAVDLGGQKDNPLGYSNLSDEDLERKIAELDERRRRSAESPNAGETKTPA